MGLRFRRSIKLVPGVRLNIGLRRASLSIGGKGFTYNIGSNGSRVTAGIPGSGLSYSTHLQHQNPATLLANSMPARKRYSATPFVIIAFVLGLIYVAYQPTSPSGTPVNTSTPTLPRADITGTIAESVLEENRAIEGPIPLPRPRTRPRGDGVGLPLQLVPQQ